MSSHASWDYFKAPGLFSWYSILICWPAFPFPFILTYTLFLVPTTLMYCFLLSPTFYSSLLSTTISSIFALPYSFSPSIIKVSCVFGIISSFFPVLSTSFFHFFPFSYPFSHLPCFYPFFQFVFLLFFPTLLFVQASVCCLLCLFPTSQVIYLWIRLLC